MWPSFCAAHVANAARCITALRMSHAFAEPPSSVPPSAATGRSQRRSMSPSAAWMTLEGRPNQRLMEIILHHLRTTHQLLLAADGPLYTRGVPPPPTFNVGVRTIGAGQAVQDFFHWTGGMLLEREGLQY